MFPLSQLPFVAKEHVYCMMTPIELINLSITSIRSKRSVTCFFKRKPKFQVTLQMFGKPILFMNQENNNDIYTFPYGDDISETSMEDCMEWYESVKDVLCCCINRAWFSNPHPLITDWLRSQQESVEEVVVITGCLEDVKYFLEKMRVTGKLCLDIDPTGTSQLEIPEGPDRLIMNNASFLNGEQLLRLKAPTIMLYKSILSSQEINQFLESWMTMESHLNLEFIRIKVSGQEAKEKIIDWLDEVGTHHNTISEKFPGNINFTGGHKIKRSDGRKATIVWDQCIYSC